MHCIFVHQTNQTNHVVHFFQVVYLKKLCGGFRFFNFHVSGLHLRWNCSKTPNPPYLHRTLPAMSVDHDIHHFWNKTKHCLRYVLNRLMIYGYNGYNYINDSGFKLNNSDDMIYYTIFSMVESLESNIFSASHLFHPFRLLVIVPIIVKFWCLFTFLCFDNKIFAD